MGQLQVPGTSVQYNNPKQVNQATNVDPTTGAAWNNGPQSYPFTVPASPPTFKVGNTPLTPGSQATTAAVGNPQPTSFDPTPPLANPVLFNQPTVAPNAGQPITTTKDTTGKTTAVHGQIPNTSVVFNSPA